MKSIILSDHAADQADAAAAARVASYEAQKAEYVQKIEQRNSKTTELRQNSQAAFRERRWFAWFSSLFSRMSHAMSSSPRAPAMAAAGKEEIVWNAGSDGEKRVADILATQLSDDWTLVSGYRNAGGEIDKLLIGPHGIMAMEIKFINGRIFCDGDQWWRDKYDRYGNLVESNLKIADKKGRGPSVQVNASADRLQAFLAQRMSMPRISRSVIFSHDSSELGRIENQTVDLVTMADKLTPAAIMKALPALSIDTVQAIELIKKDHAFHARPRPRGDSRQGARGNR